MEQEEADHQKRTLIWLREDVSNPSQVSSCLLTIMLLMHHSIVDVEELRWSIHSKAANDLVRRSSTVISAYLFPAYQAVLARTACSLTDGQIPLSHEYDWLGSGTEDQLQRIDGITGVSRGMLHIINSITVHSGVQSDYFINLSSNIFIESMKLDNRLEVTLQIAPEDKWETNQILTKTAESYRVAARVYLHCRLLGCVVWAP